MKYEIFNEYYERGFCKEMGHEEMSRFLHRHLQCVAVDENKKVYATKETSLFHEYERIEYV